MDIEYHTNNLNKRFEIVDCMRPEDQEWLKEYMQVLLDNVENKAAKIYLLSSFMTVLQILSDTETRHNGA